MSKKPTQNAAALPETASEALLLGMKPARIGAARQAKLKDAILARVAGQAQRPRAEQLLRTVRAGEGHWRPLAPKVDMQILFDDGATASWLARVAPGGRLPAHDHQAGAEECLVLSGSCWIDEVFMQAGDYQLALPGSRHANIHSEGGCMLFIKSPSLRPAARARV